MGLYQQWRLEKSIFFFSSRRWHTRFDCDWSSDVCSSDLFAKLSGAEDALGVDADADIVTANRLVQQAFGVQYQTAQCNFDDPRPWEEEFAAFRPSLVTALSVLNWVAQRDRFLQFLGRFERVLFEGHDLDMVESRRLEAVGFTRIELLGRSE